MTRVTYRPSPSAEPLKLELQGDPFDICNAIRARLFPGVEIQERDEKFEALMRARKAREVKP